MKLKVDWAENKTAKTGKPYKRVTVVSENGEKHDVNIFSNFPDFANIGPGSEIMGNLKQEGQYWNIEPEGVATMRGGAYIANKIASIDKAMDKKNESITKFQGAKEESIKLAGAQRDAVLIVTTMLDNHYEGYTETGVKEQIIKWRNWFLLSKEFNDIPPFE